MKKSVFQRAAALLLALVTVLPPAAGAITVEEARDLLRESYVCLLYTSHSAAMQRLLYHNGGRF